MTTIETGEMSWVAVEGVIERAVDDDRESVAEIAVRAVGAGFVNSDVSWVVVEEAFEQALGDDRESVAEMAAKLTRGGVEAGELSISQAGRLLEIILDSTGLIQPVAVALRTALSEAEHGAGSDIAMSLGSVIRRVLESDDIRSVDVFDICIVVRGLAVSGRVPKRPQIPEARGSRYGHRDY